MKNTRSYHETVMKLRNFFLDKNFIEVPSQSRLSILAACEDPGTVTSFNYDGIVWPLPQTGQMWLEYELLKNPQEEGFFCISTSYRNEPDPIPGRHDKIFPMFEFEAKGNLDDMINLEAELCQYLGFGDPKAITYDAACDKYNTRLLEAEHEEQLQKDLGNCISLQKFPHRSSPFWNMKRSPEDSKIYNKVDVLLYGMETIGSAERSCNVEEMITDFHTISDGGYAALLYDKFGKARVDKELEEYLALPMISRFGGGIGVTRMARALTALKESNL